MCEIEGVTVDAAKISYFGKRQYKNLMIVFVIYFCDGSQ